MGAGDGRGARRARPPRQGRHAGPSAASSSSSRTSTRSSSRRRPSAARRRAGHQARAHPLLRPDRAGDAAASRRPAAQPAALPRRRRPAGLLAEGPATDRPGLAQPLDARRASRRGPPTPTSWPTGRRPCAGSATRRPSRSTPGRSRLTAPDRPTFALIDIDPGERTTWHETLILAPALPDRPRPSRRARLSEAHRQARHPGLDPDRAALRLRRDERLGRGCLAGRRRDRARARVVGVGEGSTGRSRSPRLHPEHVHQDAGRAVRRPAGSGRARSRRRSPGTSSTTRR